MYAQPGPGPGRLVALGWRPSSRADAAEGADPSALKLSTISRTRSSLVNAEPWRSRPRRCRPPTAAPSAPQQVTTDPLSRRTIRSSRQPSSSSISRTGRRSATGPVSAISTSGQTRQGTCGSCRARGRRLRRTGWCTTRGYAHLVVMLPLPKEAVMAGNAYQPITVSRRIAASASVIFPILANPGRHRELDGSGMLRGVVSGTTISAVGGRLRDADVLPRAGRLPDDQSRGRVPAGPPDRLGARSGLGHPNAAPGAERPARGGSGGRSS